MIRQLTLGIDASNIRDGGGITHLSRVLSSMPVEELPFSKVVLWGRKSTLAAMPNRSWLKKRHVAALESSLPFRVFWQQALLPWHIKKEGCQLLFSPGGTCPAISGVPVVTMSQNLLPFESEAMAVYSQLSLFRLKMVLLKYAQSNSMLKADGLIFLSEYARRAVLSSLCVSPKGKVAVIPHGIEERFFLAPRVQEQFKACSSQKPFRLLYVSAIDNYKHQIEVAEAVADLRREGNPIAIDFVGFARSETYLRAFLDKIKEFDPGGEYLRYRGSVPFEELHLVYRQADLFVFASSCENLPNTLLESMAAGLPLACSNRGPMQEIAGEAGLYFNPENKEEIKTKLLELLTNTELRARMAEVSYARAKDFSWLRCSRSTFSFLSEVAVAAPHCSNSTFLGRHRDA